MYIPLTFEGSQAKCLFASGGYEGYFISGSQQWKYHWFTGSTNLQVQKGTIDNVQIYVIGGGGGGSRGTANVVGAGGGGGGGTNFTMNGRLFQGTYNIVVGKGADRQSTQNTSGFAGSPSSIIGTNLNLVANGGGGGIGTAGGISGNGFAGGSGVSADGGGGGGSTANGINGTIEKAGDGGAGNTFYFVGYGNGYGCGGGGYAADSSDDQGFSCNGTQYGEGGRGNNSPGDGAPYFGMGGGGGGDFGAEGGSGSVIVQYPIYDYCSNYFDETGSCDCREITFDITDPLNYYPQYTGSYVYTECGTNTFVSGTLKPYYPKTVCAASGSFFWVRGNSGYGNSTNTVNSSYPECFSASYGVQTCVTQSFPPTCTSSIITFQAGTGSTGPQTLYYVPKNATNIIYDTLQNNYITYKCTSSGSLFSNSLATYPYGISGNGSLIYTSSVTCNNVTFISNAPGATRYYKYQTCGGGQVTGTFFGTGNSLIACVDTRFFYGFYNGSTSGTSVTVGGDCLSGSIDTGSCGCP